MIKSLLTFTFCLVFLFSSRAQQEIISGQILVSTSLPLSGISKIFFDQSGLMWIGTNNGLYYFNGYNYQKLSSVFFGQNSLQDNKILDIAQNSKGNIFVVNQYGIERIELTTGIITSILEISDAQQIIGFEDQVGNEVLFFAAGGSVYSLNTKSGSYKLLYKSSVGTTPIACRLGRTIYIANSQSIVEIDIISGNKQKEISIPKTQENISHLRVLDNNNILVAAGGRIFRYYLPSGQYDEFLDLPYYISNLVVDNKGAIAFSANRQLYFFESPTVNVSSQHTLVGKIPDSPVHNLLFDRNQMIWIATSQSLFQLNPFNPGFNQTKLYDLNGIAFKSFVQLESSRNGFIYRSVNNKLFYYHALNEKSISLPFDSCRAACLVDNRLFTASENRLIAFNLEENENTKLIRKDIHVNSIRYINNKLFVAAQEGLFFLKSDSLHQISPKAVRDFLVKESGVYLLVEEGFGFLKNDTQEIEILIKDKSLEAKTRINDILQSFDGRIWIATDNGLYLYNQDSTHNQSEKFTQYYPNVVYALIEAEELPEIWFSTNEGLGAINYRTGQQMLISREDGLMQLDYLEGMAFFNKDGGLCFGTLEGYLHFRPELIYRNRKVPEVNISQAEYISSKQIKKILSVSDTIVIQPDISLLRLDLTTYDYFSPRNTRYEYSLEPASKTVNWKKVEDGNRLLIGRLNSGNYLLSIKAISSHGVVSKPSNYVVLVKVPLYQTKWAFGLYFLTLVLMVLLIVRFRTSSLLRMNREYKERAHIAKKIEGQKEELAIKNKSITDSINYARRIQLAMMPSEKQFSNHFPDSFILHIPKDIVSGDFYWVNKVGKKVFFSAVDCTGHGVPGAFMSIIGVELFRRITEIEGISEPAEILNRLSRNFERVFGDVDEMKLRDGMDLSFCAIDETHTKLEFAGAFNPLYIIRNNSILEVKGDRHSVGVYDDDDNVPSFNPHHLNLQEGDMLYIFTDGFVDQFGGPEQKKYKFRRFRLLLLALHQLPVEMQMEYLRKSILEWKGELEQVDDILVMGIRIHPKLGPQK